ncbi:MAG: hypothetical protein ACRDKY_05775 [Solirubrobacteraceae bacterium]
MIELDVTTTNRAVGDNLISSNVIAYQQDLGVALAALGFFVDDLRATYLRRSRQLMLWPYDDDGRLIGENVWEVDPSGAEIITLDRADVLTPESARELLEPLIHPLPPFDEAVMGIRY